MADVNDLAASIIADAHSAATHFDEQSATELEVLRTETTTRVAAMREKFFQQARQREDELRSQAEARRQLQTQQLILRAKQELIDAAFDQARRELEHMTAARRKELLSKLWQRTTKHLAISSVETTPKDASFFKGKTRVTTKPGLGGFIARSKDGTSSVDCRFEMLLEDVRGQSLTDVAKILFEERATAATATRSRRGGKRGR